MAKLRASLLVSAVWLASVPARADTVIVGGNLGNQTWTTAGSPYVIQGDASVQAGATLTIQAGTEVRFAGVDGQNAGLDPGLVELTVHGTLVVVGTSDLPVAFRAQSGTAAATYYGLVAAADATSVSISGVDVAHAYYGISSFAPANALQVSASTFAGNRVGVYLGDGAPTLTDVVVHSNTNYGVYVNGGARPTLERCVVHSNTLGGVYIYLTNATSPVDLSHCTVHGNGSYGVYVNPAISGTVVNIRGCNVTGNSGYGVYRFTGYGSASVSVTYSNVWGNTTNFSSVSAGAGCFSANPLYVAAPGNLRLTANSPSRFAGYSTEDLGALAYTGDPTQGLLGTLWSNTTLTAAASPYDVTGDLTVGQGTTLTIEPGATLRFSETDDMGAGFDVANTELNVVGMISAVGGAASPITLTSSGTGAASWDGVVLATTASGSTLSHVIIEKARYAVLHASTGAHALDHLELRDSVYGLYATAGTLALDASSVHGNTGYGVWLTGSVSGQVRNSVITGNSYGVRIDKSGTAASTLALVNDTIDGNSVDGVFAQELTGYAVSVSVVNSLVTNNASAGVRRASSVGTVNVTVTYSDVWNNGVDLVGVSTGPGCLAQDPLYLSPPTDLSLQSASVCIDAGTVTGAPDHDLLGVVRPLDGDGLNGAAIDMGAYELVPAPVCGDGAATGTELCDDGANNGAYGYCNADCSGSGPRCGDGLANGPEACDDGNNDDTDACTTLCLQARCGDGFVNVGVEECDDGNTVDGDECTNACTIAGCGDGVLYPAAEVCDDGNADDTDACTTACAAARCGDGYVQSGVEECELGDGCTSDCTFEDAASPAPHSEGCGCTSTGSGTYVAWALAGLVVRLNGRRRRGGS
ncbi:MAG: right-handed parallel beta-helix repeat-containing protein [Myxococcota bacterium]